MSDTQNPLGGDSDHAELQAALAAAFGDEAANWQDDAGDEFDLQASCDSNEIAALASLLAGAEAEVPAETAPVGDAALEDLLKKVSQAIEDDDVPGGDESDEVTEEAQEVGLRHVVFEIGPHQFGLPLSGVLEIDRCGKVTSLPRTPNWLRGVTNLRGQILSVTDFRHLINVTAERSVAGEKIIVVHSPRYAASTALVVERVLGIRNLISDRGPVSGLSDRIASFSDGVSVTDQATTVLINPEMLLGCHELSAFSAN